VELKLSALNATTALAVKASTARPHGRMGGFGRRH
jgi:hypothetical protein